MIEKERAFVQAAKYLKTRISLFLNLPLASLDKILLAARLREIGDAEGTTGPADPNEGGEAAGRSWITSRFPVAWPRKRLARGSSSRRSSAPASWPRSWQAGGNTIPTGAILVVLILALAPISGAHFNPAVSVVMAISGGLRRRELAAYVAAQLIGGCLGTLAAHAMFELPLLQLATTARTGPAQWFAEFVATFGLLMTILALVRFRVEAVPYGVGLYITAAYWFTASTSFANPAVTLARSLTDTFAGIAPGDVPMFVLAELAGALAGMLLMGRLLEPPGRGDHD